MIRFPDRSVPMVSVAAAFFALAACGEREAVSPEPVAEEPASVIETPADVDAALVGRWAVSTDMCERAGWEIGEQQIVTAGGTSCALDGAGAQRTETGWLIGVRCEAEGTSSTEPVVITEVPDATPRQIRVRGGLFAGEVTLRTCVPADSAPQAEDGGSASGE
ncbi:MAG: hypothetical protein ACK4E3_04945 [Brevundimonas sp.]|jgi:hypothetical protein|uniref:hypothetical protein n=1 Tax=Brevundimonas sp. TaxID=1871086 RepID=UPI003918CD18